MPNIGDERGATASSPASRVLDEFVRHGIKVRYPDEQLVVRMGIEVTGWDATRVTGTMPVAGNRQPFGLMHGGASGVLAETLGSIAAHLTAGGSATPVGLELSCTHHRSATTGVVSGVCTPLSVGRTVGTFEIVVVDERDDRVCTARLTTLFRTAVPPT